MKKVLITSATVFAIIAGAGISMAGPSRGHGHRANAHDVHSSISQARGYTDTKSKSHQSSKRSGRGSGLTSEKEVDENCTDACTDALS
ncbi:hypothetical protein [Ruegeria sp.]|uniref:hypothetical protein n=1 Tax=Ruegeria sp. TaxID=1879320 RepID=UPI003B5A8547